MPRSGSGRARPRLKYTSTRKARYTDATNEELIRYLARDTDDYLDYEFRMDRIPATLGAFNSIFHVAIWRTHRDTVWSFILPRVYSGHWIELRFKNMGGPSPHRYLMTARQFNSLELWERYLLAEGVFPLPRKNPMALKEAKTPLPSYFQVAEEW